MKKKIKVKFLDVVGDPENNFIVDILKERYDVEISENPEYLFFESKSKGFLDYKRTWATGTSTSSPSASSSTRPPPWAAP